MTRPPLERKYALTKVHPGDYLLPANDGRSLWRVARYTDGPSFGLTDWPRDRTLWGVWRYMRPVNLSSNLAPATLVDWNDWEMHESMLNTRAEAIQAALRMGS